MAGVWTKNFQSLKNIWLCGDANYYLSALKDVDGNLRYTVADTVNYHGNRFPVTSPMTMCIAAPSAGSSGSADCFIKVGSSSTAPTENDYDLTENVTGISYLSVVNEKPVWNAATGEVSNTIKLTIQNTSADAITIREWGLYARLAQYRESTYNYKYLVYHATLDAPVIIAASQSAMLTLGRTVILTDPVSWPD